MKIARLLELNQACASGRGPLQEASDRVREAARDLALNFGDHYLMKNNPLFARIRNFTVDHEFQYSLERNDAYLALPLSQLNSILTRRQIPYLDNMTVLNQVDRQVPGGVQWDEVVDNLKKNHVFHESCHAVSRVLRNQIWNPTKNLTQPSERNEAVLQILLEESFSNTCELLAVIPAKDAAHRIFFEANSYSCLFEDRKNLEAAENQLGAAFLFRFFMLTYLHSNFLLGGLDEKKMNRILKSVSPKTGGLPSSSEMKTLKALSRLPFNLNERFRSVTTGFHLRLHQAQNPLRELLDFDFMQLIEQNSAYGKYIDALVQVVHPS